MTASDSLSSYELKFEKKAGKQLEEIVKSLGSPAKQNFESALEQLQRNPYPNPLLPHGTIKKLDGLWRYKVNYHYRIIYRIVGKEVVVSQVAHRKDVYRNA